jgi:putative heme-binding domain-containing protein
LASPETRAEFLALAKLLKQAPDAGRKQLVAGLEEAFKGRALPGLPEELLAALAGAGASSVEFGARRGDPAAVAEALATIANSAKKPEQRIPLIRALGEARAQAASQPLLQLACGDADASVRRSALNALLNYTDAAIGNKVAESFAAMPAAARPAALTLLASRESWQPNLIPLLERGTLTPADLPVDIADRLRATRNRRFVELLPATGDASKAAQQRVEQIKAALRNGSGDAYAGEKLFDQRCATCHQLFHKGGRIGPNLTAYQRDDLGTMLGSIVTPSAEIREGFENVSITTKDGRVLGGFVADKDAKIVILRGFDGQDTAVSQDEVMELQSAGRSLMPDGLLDGLSDQQLRDFFAYLRIPQPISK